MIGGSFEGSVISTESNHHVCESTIQRRAHLPRPPPPPGSTGPACPPSVSRGPPTCSPKGVVAVSDGEGARQAKRGSLRPVMRVPKSPTQRLRTWRRRHDHAAPALPGRGGRTNDATNAVVPNKGRTRRSGISVLLAAAAAGRSKRHRRRLLQLPRPPAGDGVLMMTSSRGGGLPPAAFRTTIAS